jgi:hypothetical protein
MRVANPDIGMNNGTRNGISCHLVLPMNNSGASRVLQEGNASNNLLSSMETDHQDAILKDTTQVQVLDSCEYQSQAKRHERPCCGARSSEIGTREDSLNIRNNETIRDAETGSDLRVATL